MNKADLPTVELTFTEAAGFGRSKLVPWDKADLAVVEYFSKFALKLESRLLSVGSSRAWELWKKANVLVERSKLKARLLVAASLYPRHRRPRGMQRILTRNPMAFRYGRRHGHLAWRRQPGRQPLSAWEAEERLRRRRSRRYKNPGHPGRPRKDGTPAQPVSWRPKTLKLPRTKNPRPWKEHPTLGVPRHGPKLGPKAPQRPLPRDGSEVEEWIEEAIKAAGEAAIEEASDWVRDVIRGWFKARDDRSEKAR